jgi:hypothetical protein
MSEVRAIAAPAELPVDNVELSPGSVAEPSVFSLLAQQADGRTTWQLGATVVGGSINAAFFLQHSRAPWLGIAFVAVSAYGAWGLADRFLRRSTKTAGRLATVVNALTLTARGTALAVGVLSAVAAMAGFMAMAIGNWNH